MMNKFAFIIGIIILSNSTASFAEKLNNIKIYGEISTYDVYDDFQNKIRGHGISFDSVIFLCEPDDKEENFVIISRSENVLGSKAKIVLKVDDSDVYSFDAIPYGKYNNVVSYEFSKWSHDPKLILGYFSKGNILKYKIIGNFDSQGMKEFKLNGSRLAIDNFLSRCEKTYENNVKKIKNDEALIISDVEKRQSKANNYIMLELEKLNIPMSDKYNPIRYLRELNKDGRIDDETYLKIKEQYFNIINM